MKISVSRQLKSGTTKTTNNTLNGLTGLKAKIIEQNWKRNQQNLPALIVYFRDSGCTRNSSLDLMWRLWKHDNPRVTLTELIASQGTPGWMPVFYKPKSSNHNTPLKINMEHNKRGLEDAFPFPNRWLSGGVTSPSQLRWFVKLPNCCAGFDESLSNHHWHLHHFHFSLDIMAGHLGLVLAFDKLAKLSWQKRDLELNFYSFPSCSFATVHISSQKFRAKPTSIGSISESMEERLHLADLIDGKRSQNISSRTKLGQNWSCWCIHNIPYILLIV